MNKKGFAISIILYSIVMILISIFYMILGILKTRYTVTSNMREDLIEELNSSNMGADLIRRDITLATCNPIWTDNMSTSNTNDDITYLSGSNDCVNFNYVWYSGRLWRVVAIYPDGSLKMVTESPMTAINWGRSTEYNGSWIYQWLNHDFYDTLYNPSSFLQSFNLNYSTDANNPPRRPESITSQKVISTNIGILNYYEYYNAFRNSSTDNNYLNRRYSWWLVTPYDSSKIYKINYSNGNIETSGYAYSYGVRPCIVVKPGIEFKGKGLISNPYTIIGDKENPINNTTLLSSRSVGEYVNFNDELYRIVETNNPTGTTKLVKTDLVRSGGEPVGKYFASTIYFGKSGNTASNDYWDYYLNNTWYNNITAKYRNMMIDGTYYLGSYNYSSNPNYKQTVCKDANLDNLTIKNCTKYTTSDANKVFVGKVGFLRAGEMFSTNLYTTSSMPVTWLITPHNGGTLIGSAAGLYNPYSNQGLGSNLKARPTITLKAGIKITGGTGYVGGDANSPFVISE